MSTLFEQFASLPVELRNRLANVTDGLSGSDLEASAVATANIADLAVTTGKLAATAVTTAKLAAGVISADASGRALFATDVINAATLLIAVADAAFAADTATRALFADGIWTAAKLATGSVTAAKATVFTSAETTCTGAPQSVAHGLAALPTHILIVPTELPAALAAGYDIAEGTHTTSNVVFTGTSGAKVKILAWS